MGSVLAAVSGSAAVGAQTSCNVSDATTQATDAYHFHRSNDMGNAETATAAYRVLIALGATLPAWTGSQISGAAPTTPITEAQLRAFTSGRNDTWAGWNPIYTALNCLESASPTVTVGVAEPAGHRQPALTAVVANEGANSVIMVRFPEGLEGVRSVRFAPATLIRDDLKTFAPPGATATASGGASCNTGADIITSEHYTFRAIKKVWDPNKGGPGIGGFNEVWSNSNIGTRSIGGPTIAKRSGEVANVPVTLCPGSEGKTFGLKWDLVPRNGIAESDSFAHDAANCKDRTYRRNAYYRASSARTSPQTRAKGELYRAGGAYPGSPEEASDTLVYPAKTVNQAHRCWTTVTIVGQGQGGQPAVEEGDSQPAQDEGQPAQQDSQPAQEEPVVDPEPGPVCVSDALLADVEGYAAETWRKSADHVPRWSRVLAAFGQANSYSANPMTASEAQTYADRSWGSRWVPVTAALQCLEAEAS
ncbi:hypothetical protein [Candidatus Poriferisodalis sp.]|uniref:hypothetical protein n=1 Tax=Candidatus Poriferisodalis sp. TaxID=3101277 RepID=UPI003B523C07